MACCMFSLVLIVISRRIATRVGFLFLLLGYVRFKPWVWAHACFWLCGERRWRTPLGVWLWHCRCGAVWRWESGLWASCKAGMAVGHSGARDTQWLYPLMVTPPSPLLFWSKGGHVLLLLLISGETHLSLFLFLWPFGDQVSVLIP